MKTKITVTHPAVELSSPKYKAGDLFKSSDEGSHILLLTQTSACKYQLIDLNDANRWDGVTFELQDLNNGNFHDHLRNSSLYPCTIGTTITFEVLNA